MPICLPMMSGSRPKREAQIPSPMTTTRGASIDSSASIRYCPSSGGTRSMANVDAETSAPRTSSAFPSGECTFHGSERAAAT